MVRAAYSKMSANSTLPCSLVDADFCESLDGRRAPKKEAPFDRLELFKSWMHRRRLVTAGAVVADGGPFIAPAESDGAAGAGLNEFLKQENCLPSQPASPSSRSKNA